MLGLQWAEHLCSEKHILLVFRLKRFARFLIESAQNLPIEDPLLYWSFLLSFTQRACSCFHRFQVHAYKFIRSNHLYDAFLQLI